MDAARPADDLGSLRPRPRRLAELVGPAAEGPVLGEGDAVDAGEGRAGEARLDDFQAVAQLKVGP